MHFYRQFHHDALSEALTIQWQNLQSLKGRFGEFTPPNAISMATEIEAEVSRLLEINPGRSEESLRDFVLGSFGLKLPEQTRKEMHFLPEVRALFATITILSQALCEALANEVLAVGLAMSSTMSLFPLLEGASFVEKWTEAPKVFAPNYELSKSTALYESLKRLQKQRNVLAHHKIKLVIDGQPMLAGTPLELEGIAAAFDWMHRFLSLPYDLVEHAARQAGEVLKNGAIRRGSIERAPQHI